MANKLKVRFIYRDKPGNDNDSGQRIFSCNDDQDNADNSNNLAIYNIVAILAINSDIEQFLHSSTGSAFER